MVEVFKRFSKKKLVDFLEVNALVTAVRIDLEPAGVHGLSYWPMSIASCEARLRVLTEIVSTWISRRFLTRSIPPCFG